MTERTPDPADVEPDAIVTPSGADPSGDPEVESPQPVVRGGLALWALFLGFGLLMVGNGLNLAVVGVRVVDEGFGVRTGGWVMACYFVGFLLGPVAVTRMLSTVGHIRVFAGLASLASGAVLIHSISVVPITWALMRLVFGFCMAGLYVVLESWLNDASTPTTRGRTLAVYMVVSMGGLGLGQGIIAFADPGGFRLFIVASVLVSLALVPVTLAATTEAPPVREADRLGLRELYRTVPTGMIGMFFTGMSHGILFAIGALWATESGLEPSRVAAFLLMPTLGSLVFQWPVGLLSDRVPRRGVIFLVACAAVGCALTLAMLPADSVVVLGVMFVLGGMTFPLYSLLLSYTLDWSAPGKAIGASGTLLRVNGAGAVVGPVVAAPVMSAFGTDAFFWSLVVTHGMIATYVGVRIVVRPGLPLDEQGDFVPLPARSTELAVRLARRPLAASRAALRRR